jgi:uncharacterized membrane protein YdjX (TVP38/TMEM64 family)
MVFDLSRKLGSKILQKKINKQKHTKRYEEKGEKKEKRQMRNKE